MANSTTFNNNISANTLCKILRRNNGYHSTNFKVGIFSDLERFIDSETTIRDVLYNYNLLDTILFLEKEYNSKRKAERIVNLLINIDKECNIARSNDINIALNDNFEVSLGIKKNDIFLDKKKLKICPLRNVILLLGYDRSCIILRMILERNKKVTKENKETGVPNSYKYIKLHDISLNLPEKFTDHNVTESYKSKFADEVFNFIKRLLSDYSDTSIIYTLLNFLNYRKVRNFKNIDECMNYINIVKDARRGMSVGSDSTEDKVSNYHLLISNNFDSSFIRYSKKPCDVNTIGERTLCCFKPGGLANSLLKPAIFSPISGIFYGEYGKLTWFSFVWEIVEWNENNNEFEVNLILDNLEANQMLNDSNFQYIMDTLKAKTSYKRIYLGNSRNDLSTECYKLMDQYKFDENFLTDNGYVNNKSTKPRPYTLVGYEKNFSSYHYDDSLNLITVVENDFEDNDIHVSLMDNSWLHRSKYVEKLLYEEDNDPNYLTIDVEKSPCFIIHSSNKIYGYFVTRLLKMRKKDNYIFFDSKEYKHEKKTLTDELKFNENDYVDVIYFEDIFISNNRKIISSLKYMIDYIQKFVLDNNIKFYSASFNKYSKMFNKRIKGLEFIKDSRISENNPYTSNKVEELRKNNLNNEKINILIDF